MRHAAPVIQAALIPAILLISAVDAMSQAQQVPALIKPDPETTLLITQLASGDRALAARAESALIGMGPRSTPGVTAWLMGPQRDQRAVAAVLRVIARVRDPEATRALWGEWEHEETRDALIDTWAVFGDACVSPLAGYFASASTSQQERIIGALGRVGQPAVPALKGLRNLLAADQSSLADRLGARIDLALLKAPVVSLERKGPVAWRDLETMAADPETPPPVAEEAIRGLAAIMAGAEEAAQALMRLAGKPLTPELHSVLDPSADDARLLLLARKGEGAIAEYAGIARDPSSRDGLRMGAINALFGLGPPALPAMEKLSTELPAGALSSYTKELTAAMRTMPAAPKGTAGKPPAAPARPGVSACLGDAPFTMIARIDAGQATISPRWFQRTVDGTRLVYATVELGLYRLVTSKPDGTDVVKISPLAHQFAPSWSSDARHLGFLGSKASIASPFEYVDVYVSGPDGTSPKKVTAASGAYVSPVWLPRRAELVYGANTFASPQTGGAEQTSSILFRYDDATGGTRPLLTLTDRIITTIEPSPDGRRIAFLSWRTAEPELGLLMLHVTDIEGASPRALPLVAGSLVAAGGKPFDPKEALVFGGDLSWTAGGRLLTAAGRIVDPDAWKVTGSIDLDDNRYSVRAVSRTLFSDDGRCAFFDDTRQVMKRCPPDRAAQPMADCRGALLWLDPAREQLGLYDALSGAFGVVQLPRRVPISP